MSEIYEVIDEVLNGSTSYSKEEIREAALYTYKRQPPHQCYWNNRFFLAITFDLPEGTQRQAAWMSVVNGFNGLIGLKSYWEWKTHSGYDLVRALRSIGITNMVPESLNDVPDHIYTDVDRAVLEQIVDKFKLPTIHFSGRPKNDWSEEEKYFRNLVNNVKAEFW